MRAAREKIHRESKSPERSGPKRLYRRNGYATLLSEHSGAILVPPSVVEILQSEIQPNRVDHSPSLASVGAMLSRMGRTCSKFGRWVVHVVEFAPDSVRCRVWLLSGELVTDLVEFGPPLTPNGPHWGPMSTDDGGGSPDASQIPIRIGRSYPELDRNSTKVGAMSAKFGPHRE